VGGGDFFAAGETEGVFLTDPAYRGLFGVFRVLEL
jgi:hypothetical protein